MPSDRSNNLFSRLKRAVSKVRFLLSFNFRQWVLSSSRRRLALDSRTHSSGLLDIADELGIYLFGSSTSPARLRCSLSMNGSSSSSPKLRTPSPPLLRSMSRAASISSASSSDDINQKAEDFIQNFYRQLKMERQISLQLRYCDDS